MSQSDLFLEKYQIQSSRLPGWDYSTPGWYFVTICTKERVNYFGEIVECKMRRNEMGEIVAEEIRKTEEIRKKVTIDSWVVMPDHVHLILLIQDEDLVETPRRGVSTEEHKSWKPSCLGSIINQLKGACTRRIRSQIDPTFAWQSRFYDHVIRTERDLDDLQQYISLNPERTFISV